MKRPGATRAFTFKANALEIIELLKITQNFAAERGHFLCGRDLYTENEEKTKGDLVIETV